MPTGIYFRTEECRRILSNAKIGNKNALGKHWKLSQKTKEKLSLAHKGTKKPWAGRYTKSLEHRIKISERMKGKRYAKGCRHSEEARLKQRLAKLGKFVGEKHPTWKGGYEWKLHCNRQYRAMKKNALGTFSFQDWCDLKMKFQNKCLSCGKKEPEIRLTVDHIIPLSRGGSNYINNIQPLCQKCNSAKCNKVIIYAKN